MRTDAGPAGHRRRPRVLDLFCGAGGAGAGYWRAGFDVVGVDISPRPTYPYTFVQGDALDAMREMGQDFDLVHTSPPCQASTALTKGTNRGRRHHIDLIPQVRELCEWYGVPWVIENVPGADIRRDLTLCGEQFGLGVIRHRHFEIGWIGADPAVQPAHVPHRGPVRGWRHGVWRDGPYIAAYGKGGGKGSVAEMQAAMDITWTSVHEELTEAIPPAYTCYLGEQFITTGEWGAAWEPDPAARLEAVTRTDQIAA
ncbi:DNA methylase [Streptomyces uncialis]|uniref:DNA methylase n=1 Tax=Streptomyces uncialis TaxID=1048205 RepID=UPI0036493426